MDNDNDVKELDFRKYLKLVQSYVDEIHWDDKNKKIVGCGVCMSVCGILSIILSIVLFVTIGSLITAGIKENAVVTGEDSPGYTFWYSNLSDESPAEYECYYFFNLTNVDAVLQGETPVYVEKGPYCYREYKEKQNIVFSDDGNIVNRTIWTWYEWAPEASNGNSKEDIFVNLSPGYLGILAGTKGEQGLVAGFAGPCLQYNVIWLTSIFVHHIKCSNMATYLLQQQTLLLNSTTIADFYNTWANSTSPPTSSWEGMLVSYQSTTSGISTISAQMMWDTNDPYSFVNENAAEYWFNATYPTFVSPFGYDVIIPPSSEARDFLKSHFNLTDNQIDMVSTWLNNSFFPLILDPQLVSIYSKQDAGVQTVEDIGWLQWAQCNVLSNRGKTSASDVYPFAPGGIPDYACFTTTIKWHHIPIHISGHLSIGQAKELLAGEKGIFSMVNFAEFLENLLLTLSPKCSTGDLARNNTMCSECSGCQVLACYGNETSCDFSGQNITCDVFYPSDNNCTTEWIDVTTTCEYCDSCTYNSTFPDSPFVDCSSCSVCNATQCSSTPSCNYCTETNRCFNTDQWQKINDTWGIDIEETLPLLLYLNYTINQYSKQYLEKVLFHAGGGLFPRRTLDQWIFHQEDPLMLLANPTDPGAGNLIQNHTQAEAQAFPSSSLYTGKNDISQVAQYITWGNQTKIPYPFYAEDVPIHGTDEWGQFPPLMNENNIKTLTSWDPNYIRPVTIEKVGEVMYRDVLLWRFMVQNNTLLPNPLYYQSIQGFANSTSFHYGSPIFYSNPHFAGCDDKYANKVIGCKENQSYLTDYTVVDIEPNTGLVMHVNESIQLNVYLDPKVWTNRLKVFYPNVPQDIFYPIIWATQETTMNKKNVQEFQMGVINSRWLQKAIFGVTFSIGTLLLVGTVIIGFVFVKRNNNRNAIEVGDEDVNLINPETEDDRL